MRTQRVKTRPQFQAVLAGAIVAKTDHFALHRGACKIGISFSRDADGSDAECLFRLPATWLGAMVPKRWARRAATRNLIKRQIYSVSANFLQQYPQAAFVVRLRCEFARKEFFSASSEPLKNAVRVELQSLMFAGLGVA